MSKMGNRIRELRTSKSLSQEQLADKLGVTKQAISQMERGVRKPSMEMLDALCDFFNVSGLFRQIVLRHLSRDSILLNVLVKFVHDLTSSSRFFEFITNDFVNQQIRY